MENTKEIDIDGNGKNITKISRINERISNVLDLKKILNEENIKLLEDLITNGGLDPNDLHAILFPKITRHISYSDKGNIDLIINELTKICQLYQKSNTSKSLEELLLNEKKQAKIDKEQIKKEEIDIKTFEKILSKTFPETIPIPSPSKNQTYEEFISDPKQKDLENKLSSLNKYFLNNESTKKEIEESTEINTTKEDIKKIASKYITTPEYRMSIVGNTYQISFLLRNLGFKEGISIVFSDKLGYDECCAIADSIKNGQGLRENMMLLFLGKKIDNNGFSNICKSIAQTGGIPANTYLDLSNINLPIKSINSLVQLIEDNGGIREGTILSLKGCNLKNKGIVKVSQSLNKAGGVGKKSQISFWNNKIDDEGFVTFVDNIIKDGYIDEKCMFSFWGNNITDKGLEYLGKNISNLGTIPEGIELYFLENPISQEGIIKFIKLVTKKDQKNPYIKLHFSGEVSYGDMEEKLNEKEMSFLNNNITILNGP